jgi:hypothetical protein
MDGAGGHIEEVSAPPVVGATVGPLGRVLQLFALTSFALSQPILSSMREGAGFFVSRGFRSGDIVWFVVLLTLVPGLVASALYGIASWLHGEFGRILFLTLIGASVALTAYVPLVRLGYGSKPAVVAVAGLIGLGAIRAWSRLGWPETLLVYLGAGPLVFALLFLLTDPIRPLVWPGSEEVAPVEVEATAPVVFVMLDEFPLLSMLDDSGRIDGGRFPNFQRLAGDSTWYPKTVAADGRTVAAVPAVLSGGLGEPGALPTYQNYPGNLFTLFGGSYRLSVSEPFTHLCPPEFCPSEQEERVSESGGVAGLVESARSLYWMMLDFDPRADASVSDPFGEFLDLGQRAIVSEDVAEQSATNQFERFENWLATIDSEERSLYFIHLFLPHAPFAYYPSGIRYEAGGELPGQTDETWTDERLATVGWRRHLLQAQATDILIGDLLDRLEEVGIYQQSLVVVTADHGISFRPGQPRRRPTVGNVADVGLVPLFIKEPGQVDARVEEQPLSGVDILPKIADSLGIEIPWLEDGVGRSTGGLGLPGVRDKDEIVEFDDIGSALADAIEKRVERVGPADAVLFPYAGGPYSDLLGKKPPAAVRESDATGWIDRPDRFIRVVPESGFVPGLIHGGVAGDRDGSHHVAVVVEGVVAGLAPLGPSGEFDIVLPDWVFDGGATDVELYLLKGAPGSADLLRVELPAPELFVLLRTAAGEVLVGPDGRRCPAEPSSEQAGYVDAAEPFQDGVPTLDPQDVVLYGWAFDTRSSRAAERIVVFMNDEFAAVGEVGLARPGLDEALGSPLAGQAGFAITVSNVEQQDPLVVRAFALFGSRCVELGILDGATTELQVVAS